ncbi:MAG: hypothetical protein LBE55_02115 [Clostridiales bacterium]|jgi:hypothetical protein|nr:hypothetical protein [Clostridiales bacterium]
MKKIVSVKGVFIFIVSGTLILLMLAACGDNIPYDYNNSSSIINDVAQPDTDIDIAIPTPEHVPQTPENSHTSLTVEAAAYLFGRLQDMWDADGGEMWGVPLHVPVIFVCGDTHIAMANRPDSQGEFIRQYADDIAVYIGTRRPIEYFIYLTWDGQRGVMWSWDFMHDIDPGLKSIVHTGFHTLQRSLFGFYGATGFGSGAAESWASILLELNALVYALNNTGDIRLEAVEHALSIRYSRRQNFRDYAHLENEIQLSEGTAHYTEMHIVFSRYEIDELIQYWPGMFMEIDSGSDVAIFFGYYSGTLYGTLLDDFGVSWRPYIDRHTDLGLILADALGITTFMPLYEIDLEKYGYNEITKRVHPHD